MGLRAALATALLLMALPLLAQTVTERKGAEAEPEEIYLATPPRVLKTVPAEVPGDTVFPAPLVTVTLAIEVDETGTVGAVAVAQGAGEPFDGAAVAAAQQFEFDPGVASNGETVAVTVTYRIRFEEPPPPPKEPVTLTGRLLERGTRKPLADVTVVAKALGDVPEGGGDRPILETVAETVTGADGRFEIVSPATLFQIFALPVGHEKLAVVVEAVEGERREETFYLESVGRGLKLVVRAKAVKREVTKRVIPREVVRTIPGTQGDTVKVVQSLPGVARAPFGGGLLVLRGANPGDSRVFLEGLDIPLVYHFGGLRSTFNGWFLDSVEFVPGNFSSEFGRATGGVIDLQVRDPSTDLFRGEVDVNVYDAGFALEGPISDEWSLGGAFHRSYIDAILPAVIPDDADVSFDTAPRYYDYQFLATWRPNEDHKLRVVWFGSNDKIVLLFDEPADDPKVRGDLDVGLMFHNVMVQAEGKVTSWLKHESMLAFGGQQIDTEIGPDFLFKLTVYSGTARSAWTAELLDWLAIRGGLDFRMNYAEVELSGIRPPREGEPDVPLSTRETESVSTDGWSVRPALFLEAEFRPYPNWTITPSLRLDYYSEIEHLSVDPRLVTRWEIIPGTVLKAGAGLYQQPPQEFETTPDFGTPSLDPTRSVHVSLGAEQQILDYVSVEVTGFYKWLDRVVVNNPDLASDPEATPYSNDGSGRIFGVEALIKGQYEDIFQGWIAYTFQRSYRTDGPDAAERLFDFDQPHILTFVGQWELGRGWKIGARFRLVSGNPDTPIVSAIYDAKTDTYVPVYGETNSDRLSTFHQLDVRIDKVWTFDTWKLDLYLDVQNVYYHANQEGWVYSYDYRERRVLAPIPILPVIGIKGEW